MTRIVTIILASLSMMAFTNQQNNNSMNNNDVKVLMHTTEGDITLLLYGDTPKHKKNFIKLVNEGLYDGVLFHRVISGFMIQTGDPDSKTAAQGQMLGMGDPGYTLEAEFVYPKYFHKRGALAAARQGDQSNPDRRSSGSQFYIVTGQVYNAGQLDQMEQRMAMEQKKQIFNRLASEHRDTIMAMRRNRDQMGLQQLQDELIKKTDAEAVKNPFKLTEAQREAYTTIGGTPHLDGAYTVFGEVVSGYDTVVKIEGVDTDGHDRPKTDVKVLSLTIIDD